MKKQVRWIPVLTCLMVLSASQIHAGITDNSNLNLFENKTDEFESILSAEKQTMYLTTNAKVRESTETFSNVVATQDKGTTVKIMEVVGNNAKILTSTGGTGYVSLDILTDNPVTIFNGTDVIKYASEDGIEFKKYPSSNAETMGTFNFNDSVHIVGTNDYDYWQVEQDGNIYYVNHNELTDEKTPVVVQTTPTYFVSNGSGLTKSGGVNYYNGRKETYYSSRVLYHYLTATWALDAEGFYRSGDYYVVAASDMPQGTVFDCSKGTCIVLDCGCDPGTTDYYVAW